MNIFDRTSVYCNYLLKKEKKKWKYEKVGSKSPAVRKTEQINLLRGPEFLPEMVTPASHSRTLLLPLDLFLYFILFVPQDVPLTL